MTRILYSVDKLADAVATSKNFTEVCAILGIRRTGNSYQRMRRLIDEHNIDSSHFQNDNTIGLAKKKHWSEVLVSGYKDRIKSHRIRRALIESGEPYNCKLCGQEPFWNGEELVLQVDHVDGDHTNSDKKNLRFLCPNCHTQQSDQCNRCKHCNKKISRKAKWCLKCQRFFRSTITKADRPELEILFDDVEKLGYCGTGRKYGVSDNCIRKWIRVERARRDLVR